MIGRGVKCNVNMRQQTACLRADTFEGCDEEEMGADGGRVQSRYIDRRREVDKGGYSALTERETERKLQRELEHELSTYGVTNFPL